MLREVATRVGTPVAGMQPLEQARWQRSDAGQRHNASTLRHLEKLLRAIPSRRLPESADPRSPRHWEGELDSPALLLAVRSIADQLGVDSAPVLLAVFAVALVRITGIDPVVVRPVVSNRFRRGFADVVCNAAQSGLCALEVADTSLADAVRRAQGAAMGTYKHAYFDPEQMRALVAQVAAERGPDFDVSCFFNDRRLATRSAATGLRATPEQLRAARYSTTFRWTNAQDDPFERLFLHVEDVPDTIRLAVSFDTHHLAPADAEALMRGMEAVAVETALDPQAPAVGAASSAAE